MIKVMNLAQRTEAKKKIREIFGSFGMIESIQAPVKSPWITFIIKANRTQADALNGYIYSPNTFEVGSNYRVMKVTTAKEFKYNQWATIYTLTVVGDVKPSQLV